VPFAVPIATLNSDVATKGVVVERVTVAVTVVTSFVFNFALGFLTKFEFPKTLLM
jgi:hypothetical protein